MVSNAPGSASTMDRERGFEDVIKAEFPGIRIVAHGDSPITEIIAVLIPISDPSTFRRAPPEFPG
mgnify:CR=1 FL=1